VQTAVENAVKWWAGDVADITECDIPILVTLSQKGLIAMTSDERREFLDLYEKIAANEEALYGLVYDYHGDDTWEHVFRVYNPAELYDTVALINHIKQW
jgi:hypothetical protein